MVEEETKLLHKVHVSICTMKEKEKEVCGF